MDRRSDDRTDRRTDRRNDRRQYPTTKYHKKWGDYIQKYAFLSLNAFQHALHSHLYFEMQYLGDKSSSIHNIQEEYEWLIHDIKHHKDKQLWSPDRKTSLAETVELTKR